MSGPFDPVLVTGGAGFVGCCAVRRLLANGADVHLLLKPGAESWRLHDIHDRLKIHDADLMDAEGVRAIVESVRPAAVVHLATHGAYEWQADARTILATNVAGTYNLLEPVLRTDTRVFVNVGSSSEYGYRQEPMRETDRLAPNSVYAVAKAAQTHLTSLLGSQGPTGVVTFRLFSVYGPWEEPKRLLPTVIRRAKAGLPLEMVSPDTARDFVYVDDVLDALLDFDALGGSRGDVFNLGTGVECPLKDLVAVVLEVLGSRSEVRWGAVPARRWDATRWQADVSKAREILGWYPRHSLREGVARMSEWMETVGRSYGAA